MVVAAVATVLAAEAAVLAAEAAVTRRPSAAVAGRWWRAGVREQLRSALFDRVRAGSQVGGRDCGCELTLLSAAASSTARSVNDLALGLRVRHEGHASRWSGGSFGREQESSKKERGSHLDEALVLILVGRGRAAGAASDTLSRRQRTHLCAVTLF